jgi:hypothetical protein
MDRPCLGKRPSIPAVALPNAWIVAAVGLAILGLTGVAAGSSEGDAGRTAPEPLTVFLYGPAGRLAGTPVSRSAPAPDPARLRPYDTAGRDPALELQSDDPRVLFGAWRVTATPVPVGEPVVLAEREGPGPSAERITLEPPPPGSWILRATLVPADPSGASFDRVWRVIVPDRSPPETLPAPDVVLFGGGSTLLAVPGSGCYVGVCGDIGREPPSGTLPRLRLDRPDEPVTVTLSDGAPIAAIRVTGRRIGEDGREGRAVRLLDTTLEPPASPVLVPPPRSGTWRLELLVRFDFERGYQTAYARLRVP